MKIEIKKIIKKENKIEILYKQSGMNEYLDDSITPFWEYDRNIEDVPDSIAIIPFVSNLLPMIFVLDAELIVDELDEDFYNCITQYRNGYQEMIPMISFKGNIIVNKAVSNHYDVIKNCLLYSGGIDATSSLAVNEGNIEDCITIWGSDVKANNLEGWNRLSETIEENVKKYGKNWIVIRSNFRDYVLENNLSEFVKDSGDGWWHGFQHGVALLGQVAPLAYLNKYKNIFIASSFTKDYRPICASDPLTDNCFVVGSTRTIHDGFEYDRCEKVKNIFNSIDKKNITLNLHVCWESASGKNCGHCEKCIRSYLNCRSVGGDSSKIGLTPSINMNEIKKFYLHKVYFDKNAKYRFSIIADMIKKTYSNNIPKDLEWIVNLDINKVNKSLYWKLKKIYRGLKNE